MDYLTEMFLEEAEEILQVMQAAIETFKEETDPKALSAAKDRLKSGAHTLKGSSRAVEMTEVEILSEALEESLKLSTYEQIKYAPENQELLQTALNFITKTLRSEGEPLSVAEVQDCQDRLDNLPNTKVEVPAELAEQTARAEAPVTLKPKKKKRAPRKKKKEKEEKSVESTGGLENVFVTEALANVKVIEDFLKTAGKKSSRKKNLPAVVAAALNLEGGARTVDHPILESLSERLKSLFITCQSADGQAGGLFVQSVQSATETIRTCIQSIASGDDNLSVDEAFGVQNLLGAAEDEIGSPAVLPETLSPEDEAELDANFEPSGEMSFESNLEGLFRQEAEDKVGELVSDVLKLEQNLSAKEQEQVLDSIYRQFHSLKGAARSVGEFGMESLCQGSESYLAAVRNKTESLSEPGLDGLHRVVDFMTALIRPSEEQQPTAEQIRQVSDFLENMAEGEVGILAPLAPMPTATPVSPSPSTASQAGEVESIRMPVSKLEKLAAQADELLSLKLASQQRSADLRNLLGDFENWDEQWSLTAGEADKLKLTGGKVSLRASKKIGAFLKFNARFVESFQSALYGVSREADGDRRRSGALVDETRENARKLLMYPFTTILHRMPKTVRDLSKALGKQVDVRIEGAQVEIDRRILDELQDPLLHLVRNSLDHGIESPELRVANNKPPRAKLDIHIKTQRGNQIEVVVRDDGAGIDTAKLKRAAIKSGKLSKEKAAGMSTKELQELIFLSDVSTSAGVTEISGRGLGMAIVRENVKKLGGTLVLDSKLGAGTSFTIVLPLTLATFRGILTKTADRTFVFPTFAVERVLRTRPSKDIHLVEKVPNIFVEGRVVPLLHLSDQLGLPRQSAESEQLLTLVIESGQKRVALVVDEILAEQEVLVRELKPPLSFIPALSGISVLGNGELAPILSAEYLVGSSITSKTTSSGVSSVQKKGPSDWKILVADDSITSRTLLKNIVESAGYYVKTASDGQEAFEMLKAGQWDLVVSDIEMPRLNGMEFTRRVRNEPGYEDTPIILCSTLAKPEDQRRGLESGANDYVVKGGRSQTTLIEAIKALLI